MEELELSLPDNLAALAVEDIQELIEAAREEFHTLNDSDSLEDETLDRMTVLADTIDALHDEYVSKVELAVSKRDAISARVFGTATTVTFNLDNLNSASDHVDQAIDALEQDSPDIASALSDARSAETLLKAAVKSYGGATHTRRVGPKPASVGVNIGVYKAATEEFNIKYTTSALDDVSAAIDDLVNEDVESALNNLNDAADEIDNSIDSYDNGVGVDVGPSSGYGLSDTTELKADTEEFASCASARRRVRVARRNLRKAVLALRNCSGTRVVVLNPPPPPAPGMSAEGVEFAGLPAGPPYKVRAQFGKFCVAGDNGKGAILKGGCFATKAEAQAKIDSLSSSASGVAVQLAATVTKSEADGQYPASDYAYVPDPQHPSTWKLRLTSSPGGDPDPRIVGAAVAALGKGFRGNKVQIPAEDLSKVKAKVKAAWLKANSDKTADDLPSILK